VAAVSVHIPLRPEWRCAGCSLAWPCATRQDQLVAEYSADALPLALYLAACLVDAAYDLPETPAGVLYQRFLGWLRDRQLPAGRS
jgi:hypothetical protein